MNKVKIVEKIIREEVLPSMELSHIEVFDTRNIVGDPMENIYDKDGIQIDVCYAYEYVEVFGLSEEEFKELSLLDICDKDFW